MIFQILMVAGQVAASVGGAKVMSTVLKSVNPVTTSNVMATCVKVGKWGLAGAAGTIAAKEVVSTIKIAENQYKKFRAKIKKEVRAEIVEETNETETEAE